MDKKRLKIWDLIKKEKKTIPKNLGKKEKYKIWKNINKIYIKMVKINKICKKGRRIKK